MHGVIFFLFALTLATALGGCDNDPVEKQICLPESLLQRVEVKLTPKDKIVESTKSEKLAKL